MLSVTTLIVGKGLEGKVTLIKDGRLSGRSHGFVIGYVAPEAQVGGPIVFLQNGDKVIIDSESQEMTFNITDEKLQRLNSRLSLNVIFFTLKLESVGMK